MSGHIDGSWHLRGSRTIWRACTAAVVILAAAVAHGAAPTSAQEAEAGSVRVVHGLRGLVADIYLDGTLVLATFQPERSTAPLAIPAGVHEIDIRQAGASAEDEPLLSQQVDVPAGFRGSLVAHLDRDGDPVLTAYADDVTPVPAGQSRVVVRHAAAAGPVAVLLDEWPTFGRVRVNREIAQVIGAGQYEVSVTAVDGDRPLAAPQDVEYREGTATFMYLIGSQSEGTLGWAAVRINNLETAPTKIQTGDGSGRATSTGLHPGLIAGMFVGGTALAGGVWLSRRRAAV